MFVRLTLLPSLLAACSTLSPNPNLSCGGAGPNTLYFPARTFVQPDTDAYTHYGLGTAHDADAREDYSSTLAFLGEPSLSCGAATTDEAYRFVWSPSFDPPATVRITRIGDSYLLDAATSVATHGNGYRVHRALSPEEWSGMTTLIAELNFWNQPTYNDPPFAIDNPSDGTVTINGQFDGARWIVEGRSRQYHVIDRWSGDRVGTSIGLAFLKLADLGLSEEDIY